MLPGLLRTEHYRLEVSRRRAAAGSGETGGHTPAQLQFAAHSPYARTHLGGSHPRGDTDLEGFVCKMKGVVESGDMIDALLSGYLQGH